MRPEDVPPAALDVCGSCKAETIWTVTEKGKRMMVDRVPGVEGANLSLTVVSGEVKSRVVATLLAFGNRTLHLSHFASCPQASTHRKVRRRSHAERRLS